MKKRFVIAAIGLIVNAVCVILVAHAVLRYQQDWAQFRPEIRAAHAERLLKILNYGILPMHGFVALLSATFFWMLRK